MIDQPYTVDFVRFTPRCTTGSFRKKHSPCTLELHLSLTGWSAHVSLRQVRAVLTGDDAETWKTLAAGDRVRVQGGPAAVQNRRSGGLTVLEVSRIRSVHAPQTDGASAAA